MGNRPQWMTPIERSDGVWFKRDDLFEINGVRGGKVRTCLALARKSTKGLITAGSRKSPQIQIVAYVAEYLGRPSYAVTPTGELDQILINATDRGIIIEQIKYGYNSVIIKRARDRAIAEDLNLIPFGMECQEAVDMTARQTRNIISFIHKINRIVVPVGSAMTLAGILKGLQGFDISVLGVVVGASPKKRLDIYAAGWEGRVRLVDSGMDYHKEVAETMFKGVDLDPIYEAKCIPFIKKNDLFWVVGNRRIV